MAPLALWSVACVIRIQVFLAIFAYYDILLISNALPVGVVGLDSTCHGLVWIQSV